MTSAPTVGGEHVAKRQRARFHPLEVAEVRRSRPTPSRSPSRCPTKLADDFTYLPGQYVALRKEFDGRAAPQLLDPPAARRGSISVAIKRDLGGQFSTWANTELKAGDTLDVMSPQGTFTSTLDALDGKHVVGIAAGWGITPLMALAHTVLARSATSEFELVYTNRSTLDVMFLEELAELKDRYPSRLALHHVLSREQRTAPLLSGRIDAEKLEHDARRADPSGDRRRVVPLRTVRARAARARHPRGEWVVAAEHVRYELFTTDADRVEPRHGRPVVVERGEQTVAIEFTLDGQSSTVESPVRRTSRS